jgi:PIN domain nuclease of toxin-antitoxin system
MIVLDTHVLVWWVSQDVQMSAAAQEAIANELGDATGQVAISAITPWEIAMLQQKGRLVLSMDMDEWLVAVESIEQVTVVPITARTAVQSTQLPGNFHKDPADRLIVALARELNAPLLTADEKIHSYPHVRSLW